MTIELPDDPVLRVQGILAWTLLHNSNVAIRRGKYGNYIVYNSSREPNFIVVGGERSGSFYSFPRAFTAQQCCCLERMLKARGVYFNEPFRGSQHRVWMSSDTNHAFRLGNKDTEAKNAEDEAEARELGLLLAKVLHPKLQKRQDA